MTATLKSRLLPAGAGFGGEPDQLGARLGRGRHLLSEQHAPRLAIQHDVEAFGIDAGHAPGAGARVAERRGIKLERIGVILRGYHDRCGRYVQALAAAAPNEGEYARLRDEAFVEMLARAAPLHDVGMLRVGPAVLSEPGPLDEGQREAIEAHARAGAERILTRLPGMSTLAEAATAHHERADGSGYPAGLNANQVSPLVKLVAVVDVYAAMCAPRPHRPAKRRPESPGAWRPPVRWRRGAAALAMQPGTMCPGRR